MRGRGVFSRALISTKFAKAPIGARPFLDGHQQISTIVRIKICTGNLNVSTLPFVAFDTIPIKKAANLAFLMYYQLSLFIYQR
jgi:hypothetical protein